MWFLENKTHEFCPINSKFLENNIFSLFYTVFESIFALDIKIYYFFDLRNVNKIYKIATAFVFTSFNESFLKFQFCRAVTSCRKMSESGVLLKLSKEVHMDHIIRYQIEEGILNDRASSASFASRLFPIYLLWHDVPSCEDIQTICSSKFDFQDKVFHQFLEGPPIVRVKNVRLELIPLQKSLPYLQL